MSADRIREEATRAYDNAAAVPGAQAWLEAFRARGQDVLRSTPVQRDLAYGSLPRQRYDWLPARGADAAQAPLLVYVHGGYWQSRAKEDFTAIAEGPLDQGLQVVLAGYTLAPQASLPDIVAEIDALLGHLRAQPRWAAVPLVLAGHSAGGHLACMLRARGGIQGVLGISGIYDLGPIAQGALNDKLGLDDAQLLRCSPLRHLGPGAPTVLAWGEAELPALQRQSRDYADALQRAGEDARALALRGRNHFDILEEFDTGGQLLLQALRLAGR